MKKIPIIPYLNNLFRLLQVIIISENYLFFYLLSFEKVGFLWCNNSDECLAPSLTNVHYNNRQMSPITNDKCSPPNLSFKHSNHQA